MKGTIKLAIGDPLGTAKDFPIPYIKVELDKESEDPRDVMLCSLFQGNVNSMKVVFDNPLHFIRPANTVIQLIANKEQEAKNDIFKRVEQALYAYLSAGTKEKREEASVLAKSVYREIAGKEYANPAK